ncbi:MAG: hypothetical protein AAFU67_15980, partial [Bacteroidota bacterium]
MLLRFFSILMVMLFIASCGTPYSSLAVQQDPIQYYPSGDPITASLFNNEKSTISEEDIQRILDGTITLPATIRVAVLNMETYRNGPAYYQSERFRDLQSTHYNEFEEQLQSTGRVTKISLLPQLLVSANRNIFTLRESAVRMQADALLVFNISSDVYSEFKLFKKDEAKAYATTEVILMDVRTGIIVFTNTVSKEVIGTKQSDDTGDADFYRRIQEEAS